MVKTFAILSLLLMLTSARAQQQNQDTTTAQAPQGSLDWVQENSGTTQVGNFISYPSQDTVYISFSPLESIDGGLNWLAFSPPTNGFISFFDSQNGYDVSYSGGLAYHTSDGGRAWTSAADSMHLISFDVGVISVSRDMAFLCGDKGISRTTDAGKSWSFSDPPGKADAIAFADSNHGIFVGGSIQGPPPFYQLEASCFTTNDGGVTWIKQNVIASNNGGAGLVGVTCVNRDTFIAVGSTGYVHRSIDAGINWDTVPISVNGSLGAIASKGRRILADGYNPVSGKNSIITSTDAGLTWQDEQSGVTGGLYELAMYDENTAIVVGDSGRILKTTNGGTDWVQVSPPAVLSLAVSAYPNPSSGAVRLTYTLPQIQDVTLTIYDVTGKVTAVLLSKQLQQKGEHAITFEGNNYPAGVYAYQIRTERFQCTGKFSLTK